MPEALPLGLPPRAAIAWFRQKGYAISFAWQDVWREEHAVAFTVAKVMRQDLLEDIRSALETVLTEGRTFAQFKAELAPILRKKGWWGRQTLWDPKTQRYIRAQLGSHRRLRIIYDTNLRMAHAASRWQAIASNAENRPYLLYDAVNDSRTRPQHRVWDGRLLPVSDAWWKTHYPPNGWRCRCSVIAVSEDERAREGQELSPSPEIRHRSWRNRRTGKIEQVPEGIDPGFDSNVGTARARAFTPPPEGGLPRSYPIGVDPVTGAPYRPPLPEPRPGRLLAEETSAAEAQAAFLQAFEVPVGGVVALTDQVGQVIPISAELFRTREGGNKLLLHGRRRRQVLLVAETLKDPDEIWWIWEENRAAPGQWFLKRRYLGLFALEGAEGAQGALAVFDWSKGGWNATTGFMPDADNLKRRIDYINTQRAGLLAYRRKR